MPRPALVTSALPYGNGHLHIGHLVGYIQADIWVRARRMAGGEVHFVCANDTHGTPIMLAAEKARVAPEEFMGEVSGDLYSRRGRIESTEHRMSSIILQTRVPLSEMFGYSTSLRSMTQGRATYSMHFSHYEEAPKSVSEEIVSKVRGKLVT